MTFFAVRASDETFSTTIVTLSATFHLRTFVYNHAGRSLQEETCKFLTSADTDEDRAPFLLACPVPPDRNSDVLESVSILAMDREGTLCRWQMELADPAAGWKSVSRMRTGECTPYLIACSVDGTSALGAYRPDFPYARVSRTDDGLQHVVAMRPVQPALRSGTRKPPNSALASSSRAPWSKFEPLHTSWADADLFRAFNFTAKNSFSSVGPSRETSSRALRRRESFSTPLGGSKILYLHPRGTLWRRSRFNSRLAIVFCPEGRRC